MQAEPEISVCIVTYRRAGLLVRLLGSMTRQSGRLPAFEVLVVDNDAAGSAAGVCREFEVSLPIRYVVEPKHGISHARNRSVQASRGRFIVYVDDDQEVGPDWLATLYAAAIESGADGIFAPIIIKMEGVLPEWIRSGGFFNYPQLVAGSAIPWYSARTGNCCLRRAALPSDAPFDPSLALIGGEDVELFSRMSREGAELIAVAAPVIIEHRTAARANAAWLIRRRFRNGGTFAHVEWRHLSRRKRAGRALIALGKSARHVLHALPCLQRSRAEAFRHVLLAVESLGQASWVAGVVYSEYARPS